MSRASWTSFARPQHGTWLVAHRGASARRRENSPAAFEAAIADGANAIETDVRRTADGVLVCHHDDTLKRTAGLDVALAAITFDELQRSAPDYAVRLEDVLVRIDGRCNVLLDVKLHDEADIRRLVELLASRKVGDGVAIGVRSLEAHAQVRQLRPKLVQLGLLASPELAPSFIASGGRWVRLWERDASRARIAALQGLGVPVLVMVGGPGTGREIGDIDTPGARLLIERGADGLMLNDPRVARSEP